MRIVQTIINYVSSLQVDQPRIIYWHCPQTIVVMRIFLLFPTSSFIQDWRAKPKRLIRTRKLNILYFLSVLISLLMFARRILKPGFYWSKWISLCSTGLATTPHGATMSEIKLLLLLQHAHRYSIIGASLHEQAPHKRYSCARTLYGTSVMRNICPGYYGSMDISAKYFCGHSHVWATGHSNLMNSKFTLAQLGRYTVTIKKAIANVRFQARLSFFNIVASSNDLPLSFSASVEEDRERNNARAAWRCAGPDHTCTDWTKALSWVESDIPKAHELVIDRAHGLL